jgi:hypothetical protein
MKRNLIGRTLASTMLAIGLWTSVAGANPIITGQKLLDITESGRTFYMMGVIDGLWESGMLTCGTVRAGAIWSQASGLLREHPDAPATESIMAAMLQLGCQPAKASVKLPS